MSASTAELNRERAKPAFAAQLNAALGRAGGSVRSIGDRWLWQRPTGASEVFGDVEELVRHLLHKRVVSLDDFDGAETLVRRIVRRASG
ncbi:hypothetical protein FVA74_12585 [Salinibacterium sp. dk2585]|uniref:hypothetical protein n=1 Tax=unclassified Salinibacterium TaxID=2632331 RepID=UPI0011C256C7|nr:MULTISPECIES: hypothetical protein [unclassified Salinibacterium]QEE62319.1 hypothetical protein FVA74_12585 [Salinibacterium sp. dk2585]TXK53670.1 hypothetical protein FVP63_10855 [Salinibacterium sp. dk5596]